MLKISKPYVEHDHDKVRVKVDVTSETDRRVIWFEVDQEYEQYVCLERSDAYLVLLFYYAMLHGEDLEFEGFISEELYYQIRYHLVDALHQADPSFKSIDIICQTTKERIPNAGAVGTGMSRGIDSLATVLLHTREDCPPHFRLTHLTFFNAGAAYQPDGTKDLNKYGEDIEIDRIKSARAFATEVGLPLLVVDSNISEFLILDHRKTHTFRNCGTVLLFQKLFSTYYYSSAGLPPSSYFLSPNVDCSHYDDFTMHYISNCSMTFYSAMTSFTRLRKTELITSYPLSYRHLNVCVSDDENCGICHKCIRTLITLDVLGKLELYDKVFDLPRYYAKRSFYMADLLANRDEEFNDEIYAEMLRRGIKLGSRTYARAMCIKIETPIKDYLRRVVSPQNYTRIKRAVYGNGN